MISPDNGQRQILFQEMHSFMMQFFNSVHQIEPNPEIMAMLRSDTGLRLVKAITDFYCEILDDEEIDWIITENLNGTGKQILNKFMLNMEHFRTTLAPTMREFEIE
jgi:hypothetical protein